MHARDLALGLALVLLGCGGHWFHPNPTLVLEPAALVLYACQGEAASEPSYLGMRSLGVDAFSWTVQAGTRVSASPQTGYGGSVWAWTVLTADASGLAAGTHTDSITVVAPECDNSPVTVPVEIAVAASGEAFMRVDPAELAFTMDYLGATPAPQSIQVSNLGTGSFDWTAEGITSWVGPFSPSSGTCTAGPDAVDVSLTSPPGTALQTYAGWLRVTATGGNVEQRVKVILSVEPTLGLVGHWEFEGTGAVATDSSGYDNHGNIVGATRVTDMLGGALDFGGDNDRVAVPDSPSLNPTSAMSVAAWIRSDGWSSRNARILQKGGDGENVTLYGRKYDSPEGLVFHLRGLTTIGVYAPLPSTSVWHHVAGTYNGSFIRVYVDGVLAASNPATGTIETSTEDLYVGTKGPTHPAYSSFDGLIDDVRVYNRALALEEIQFLAAMGD